MTSSSYGEAEMLETVEGARERIGLTYRDVAQIIGADESSLHRWRREGSSPSHVFARQIRMLGRCLDQLASAFGTWGEARRWLSSRPDRLEGQRPVDLLRQGQTDRVIGELYLMNATLPT